MSRQFTRGISLIELMVALAISLALLLVITTIMVRANSTQRELTLSNRQIENGRYATQVLSDSFQNAGYYGPQSVFPVFEKAIGTWPDDLFCETNATNYLTALNPGVYASRVTSAGSAPVPSCSIPRIEKDLLIDATASKNSDVVLVVRASSFVSVPSNSDLTAFKNALTYDSSTKLGLENGKFYIQSDTQEPLITAATGNKELDYPVFGKQWERPDPANPSVVLYKRAEVREFLVTLFFVTRCNRFASGQTECTSAADDGKPIPTLMRSDLIKGQWVTTPVAEGIELMRVELGVDDDGNDGAPDKWLTGSLSADATIYLAADKARTTDERSSIFNNVVSARLWLLARSTENIQVSADDQTNPPVYLTGTTGDAKDSFSSYSAGDSVKRQLFTRTIRLNNASGRRVS
jgi:type IV pilus assembly protein PilW